MEYKILFKADKTADRQIRLTLQEYRGKPLLDLRIYYLDSSTNEYRATKQGLTLTSPEMVDDLATVLPDALKELRKQTGRTSRN